MVARVFSMEDPAPDAPVRATREIMHRTPDPAARGDEFHTSGNVRDLRIAHEIAAEDRPGLRDAETSDDRGEDIDTIVHISEHVAERK